MDVVVERDLGKHKAFGLTPNLTRAKYINI